MNKCSNRQNKRELDRWQSIFFWQVFWQPLTVFLQPGRLRLSVEICSWCSKCCCADLQRLLLSPNRRKNPSPQMAFFCLSSSENYLFLHFPQETSPPPHPPATFKEKHAFPHKFCWGPNHTSSYLIPIMTCPQNADEKRIKQCGHVQIWNKKNMVRGLYKGGGWKKI